MWEKHRISITPKGTLTDIVETIFRGRGNSIRIYGRNYTLREYGNLSEQDPIRVAMLRELEAWARDNPGRRYSNEIELDGQKGIEQPTLKVLFTRAEEIPSMQEDKGSHQYLIIEGTRYKVEIEGDLKAGGITSNEIMREGRKMISSFYKNQGRLPKSIELRQK